MASKGAEQMARTVWIISVGAAAVWALALACPCVAKARSRPASRPAARAKGGMMIVFPPLAPAELEDFAERVGYAIYRKIKRVAGWEVVDPLTVEEAVEETAEPIGPETPPTRLRQLCRHYCDADFAVVGRVRGGSGAKQVDLAVVDLNADPPTRAYTGRFMLGRPQDLRREVEKILMALTGLSPYQRALPRSAETRWRTAKNLVPNPNMEAGDGALLRWQGQIAKEWYNPPRYDEEQAPITGSHREMIKWARAPQGGSGRCVHYAMNSDVAATYGLACYSDWIPIQEHATYRFQCRYRSTGPTIKIFVKAYDGMLAKDGTGPQRREVYRRQVHPKGPQGQWNTTTADFVPRHDQADPKWIRVDLYAYWPEGHVWFDDVVLKKIVEPRREQQIDAGRRQLSESQERVIREFD